MDATIDITALAKGHPISIYFQEKELIVQLLKELKETNPETERQKFFNIFNHLEIIKRRFERKENQLFPYLEKRGWNGPSQAMWSFHDNLREQFRLLSVKLEQRDVAGVKENIPFLLSGLYRLLAVEESVLFPKALEILDKEDWENVRKGEEEIGWMLSKTPAPFPEEQYIHPSKDTTSRDLPFSTLDRAHYDQGYMTVDQVNLLLKTMPLDITYVDENDRVIFYNRGEERLFPRSAGIIGREVRFCHPPKSVGTVIRILEEFKKGTKNESSFWITIKGRLIYIRYFAIRDEQKNYRGVIEMSQDITDIKQIEGEKRLLNWD